jgi:hypothetical protein
LPTILNHMADGEARAGIEKQALQLVTIPIIAFPG